MNFDIGQYGVTEITAPSYAATANSTPATSAPVKTTTKTATPSNGIPKTLTVSAQQQAAQAQPEKSNMMLYVGLGIAAFFLFGKKKGRRK
ncbi:MAG TPA: hypothetical protein PLA54_00210 [Spirochaetota bacterium]|nr:hypothetical protein [Spirochaetota bacterium]HQE57592.1 hypothetical protein [Spirochaetota bacterium]